MANIVKDFSYMEFPLSISRQDGFPLDKQSLWFDKEEAESYAKTSPLAYPGQYIAVVDEEQSKVDVFKVDFDGTLAPIGGGVSAIVQAKNPATSDWQYEIGQMWINSSDKSIWFLAATSDSNGIWKKMVTPEDLAGLGGGDMLASIYAKGEGAGPSTGYVDKSLVAKKLETAQDITLTGDITGTVKFDGSAAASITTTLKNTGTAGTYYKVTTDDQGRVTAGETSLTKSDISDLGTIGTAAAKDVAANTGTAEDNGKLPMLGAEGKLDKKVLPTLDTTDISGLGTAAKANTGTAEGNVPVLITGGKLPDSVLPALALTDVTTVEDMDALVAQENVQQGDVTIVTDAGDGDSKTFILSQAPASELSNWKELKSPTAKVTSVNSKKGDVVLTTDDINEGSTNQYFTEERATANFGVEWGKKTTDDLPQGSTNKYYTDDAVKTYLESSTFVLLGSNAAGTWE